MKYAIITGASRGLGEAIAKRLFKEQINVISVSRTENDELEKLALADNLYYKHYSCNLSLETEVQEVFMEISHRIYLKNPKEILLFNNAGTIEPIRTVGDLDQTPILRNIQVNLIAPILITNIFFKNAQQTESTIQVVNITSGAADRPISSWSVYCSARAGLNMFTQTAALEQAELNTKHKIIAFSPGVMETKLIETIVSASKGFEKVVPLKPEAVADALVDLVLSEKTESGKIYHVNDLLK